MTIEKKEICLWLLKKDFRVEDNPALCLALENHAEVHPLFILEPSALIAPETSNHHIQSWFCALDELNTILSDSNSKVPIVYGEYIQTLEILKKSHIITHIYAHEEIGSSRTYKRDLLLIQWCEENDVVFTELMQTGVFRRLKDRDKRSTKWHDWMNGWSKDLTSKDLSRLSWLKGTQLQLLNDDQAKSRCTEFRASFKTSTRIQKVGPISAQKCLDSFLYKRVKAYSSGLSSPNSAFSVCSRLSTHLAWGAVSPRTVINHTRWRMEEVLHTGEEDVGTWRKSLNAFKARMSWRDHFIQRLESEPSMEFYSLNRAFDKFPFNKDHEMLQKWIEGETGFPLVDACIKCATKTGYLNFRMRCMITSLACHVMHLDWRDIMWPMARWWSDYEPGIHIAQLQMQAGTVGINTLRIYNPAKQILDHDPEAKFIKRWLPELKNIDVQDIYLHQYHPGSFYIEPVVDYQMAIVMMRSEYYQISRTDEAREIKTSVLKKHGSRKRVKKKRVISKVDKK